MAKRRNITELLDGEFMARLDALDILTRKMLQGKMQGERRAKRRGQSVEFADHRPYVVGDDLRFVDWNIYGRLEQLFVKLFLEEQDLSIHLLADVSGSVTEGEPSKEGAIKRLAAALGYVGIVNNNRVTISSFADGVTGQIAHMRGRSYVRLMAEFLLTAETEGPSDFDRACRQVVASRLGRGIMVVLSDFLFKEGFEDGLRRLISRQYELYVVQVLSPQEIEPELAGDLRLVDVEDGDAAEVTVGGALLDYYRRNVSAYCNELKDFCVRRGGTYALMKTSDSVESMVLNYMRRQGLVR